MKLNSQFMTAQQNKQNPITPMVKSQQKLNELVDVKR